MNNERHTSARSAEHLQSGLTLIELMVAMVIGLFLVLGSVTVYVQSRGSFIVSDGQARLQENLRFAVDTLEPDIRLARYWGRHNEPALVQVPGGLAITCAGVNATALVTNFAQAATVIDESVGYAAAVPCPANTAARADSDVLILRHASGQPTAPGPAGQLKVRSDLGIAEVFNNAANPPGYGLNATTHDLVTNIYYVDNSSDMDLNMPSLRRWTLDVNGNLVDEEMIAGVENFQVQVGIDENGLGSVTRYVDGDDPIITPGAPGFLPNARVVALRLWMLMRNYEQEANFADNRQYAPGGETDLGPIVPGDANYPANFRRQQVTKTIRLRNNRTL